LIALTDNPAQWP